MEESNKEPHKQEATLLFQSEKIFLLMVVF